MRASQKFLDLCLSRCMTIVIANECREAIDTGITLIYVCDKASIFLKKKKKEKKFVKNILE